MKKVKYGIIGAGFVADIHLNALNHLRNSKVEVVGVAARDKNRLKSFAEKHNIPSIYTDWKKLIKQEDIDVIDICTPTNLHGVMIKEIALSGKSIICEKPLSGYFGKELNLDRVGEEVSREKMFQKINREINEIQEVINKNKVKFMYAENWIYAPPYQKMLNLLNKSDGVILDIRAEESHSGSHAQYSRTWENSGGGALLRLGAHPVAGVIHLKYFEGINRHNQPIIPESVVGEVSYNSKLDAVKRDKNSFLVKEWVDVEDWATVVINFSDGTKAIVVSSDCVLGGVRNEMRVFTTNSVVNLDMSQSNAVTAFAPIDGIFADEYITEKIETTAGWSNPSPDEDWMRGYPAEMEDFMDSIIEDKEALSGWYLAEETLKVIYAAYLSAEKGERISLNKNKEK
ncbi:gfo/Idh/MocA family oxidoreductase [Iocasia frigidifontis]|uniref:Gfo/Idh/MocA family oxidoreductase n=1 Tax=Iocasia fonsfrigidae TaxID=2682810 RepID=A0A8A7K6C5_9FIRM|nr:Gfo/Idh/MocA family oxidoreductase [Iocasia fonsfrigidae]QTL97333.1 gfo/Idh/MocA family oxidoreductase [Iocasia fonsfrigidae]